LEIAVTTALAMTKLREKEFFIEKAEGDGSFSSIDWNLVWLAGGDEL
jgi:hypothetical protein